MILFFFHECCQQAGKRERRRYGELLALVSGMGVLFAEIRIALGLLIFPRITRIGTNYGPANAGNLNKSADEYGG